MCIYRRCPLSLVEQVHKSKSLPLVLQNHGVVPVTCLFDAPDLGADVGFEHANGSLTLQPGSGPVTIDTIVRPSAAGAITKSVVMTVMHNVYETTTLQLTATAFQRDVTFQVKSGYRLETYIVRRAIYCSETYTIYMLQLTATAFQRDVTFQVQAGYGSVI